MKLNITSMIQILILTFLFKSCISLECYSCSSQIELQNGMKNECDYFSYTDKTKITDCPFPNVCAKYFVEYDGVKWVHRSCQNYNVCSRAAIKYNDNRNVLLDCVTCSDTDLCNSSERIKYSILVVILVPLLMFV